MASGNDQYDRICKSEFLEINTKLDKISNRLFVDNGGESFQSRLNRHDRWIKFVMAIVTMLTMTLIGFSIFVAQEAYKDWRGSDSTHREAIGESGPRQGAQ